MKQETLIIDDDKIMCLLHEKLCQLHYLPQPKTFMRADEALTYILRNNHSSNSFTLLLDINMPEMNGWQFLDTLQQEEIFMNLYIILLTSSVETSDEEQAGKYPLVHAFISKPLDGRKIRTLLKDQRLMEHISTV